MTRTFWSAWPAATTSRTTTGRRVASATTPFSAPRSPREMIEAGECEDVASKWAAEHKRRWEKSKFFKLWEKEKQTGRDPRKAFQERGWEP